MLLRFFFSHLLVFFFLTLSAQGKSKKYIPNSERFNAGLVVGFNASQVDGDYFKGFNKLGMTAGIRGITRLTPSFDFNIEILFSKKGSKIFHNQLGPPQRAQEERLIDLTYVDIPIFFKMTSSLRNNSFHIEFGGVYSRLFNTKIKENVANNPTEFIYTDIVDEFKRSEISAMGGIGYTWSNGFSINYRYIFSINNFYRGDDFGSPSYDPIIEQPVTFLRNYFYSVTLSYNIFASKKKKSK